MKSEIIQSNKNPFLSREELLVEIKSDSTPSMEEIKAELKRDDDVLVVRKVHSNFGKHRFLVEAMVYDSAEAKKKIEVIPKKVRKKMEEERKTAEAEAKKKVAEEKAAKEQAAKEAEEAKIAEAEKTEGASPVENQEKSSGDSSETEKKVEEKAE